MKKKAQINQVFVYLLSTIVILFVGFLVVKFVVSFSGDVGERSNSAIFSDIERDYSEIYRTWGSEKVTEYKVSTKILSVCFVNDVTNCEIDQTKVNYDQENFELLVEEGDNFILFDDDGISNSKDIGQFKVEDNCKCITPKLGKFEVVLENRKNTVHILENK